MCKFVKYDNSYSVIKTLMVNLNEIKIYNKYIFFFINYSFEESLTMISSFNKVRNIVSNFDLFMLMYMFIL